MALEKPAIVVMLYEGPDHLSGLLEGFEVVQMESLLLERADEALQDAVALRLAHGGGRGADAEAFDLGLELLCPLLRTPVVPQTEAQGDGLVEAAHATLADRAAGGGFVVCRYRNREATPPMGGWRPLHWLGCEEAWPEPRSFERLVATDGTGGGRRGGVEVTVSKDGRIYEMRCEDVSEAGSGRWFACWLP